MNLTLAARFAFTACDIYRTFPSIVSSEVSNQSLYSFGPLVASHPEHLQCIRSQGLGVDLELVTMNATSTTNASIVFLESQLNSLQMDMQDRKDMMESDSLPTSGWTFATWISPSLNTHGRVEPIITIAHHPKRGSTESESDEYSCLGYGFQMAQIHNAIQVSFTDGGVAGGLRQCRYLRTMNVLPVDGKVLTHVVVTIDSFETRIYINGSPANNGLPTQFDTTLKAWDMSNATLQLFSSYLSNNFFHGSIHQLDIWQHAVNASEAEHLFLGGILNVPTANVTVSENIEQVRIRQDAIGSTSFFLGSVNVSSYVLNLSLEVLSLPLHGVLTKNSRPVKVKMIFPLEINSSATSFEYTLNSSEYFNAPSVNAYGENLPLDRESFQFRILAFDAKRNMIASSLPAWQSIHVVHVNHPGTLLAPPQVTLDEIDPSIATVSGVQYTDDFRDEDIDRVRVDVWTAHGGQISILQSFLSLLDFDSCRNRSDWNCVGDGSNDAFMTFVAVPSDISFILRSLTYRRLDPAMEDDIFIRVSDGAGGMCLTEQDHMVHTGVAPATIHDTCFHSQVAIHVPANTTTSDPVNPKQKRSVKHALNFLSVADLLFWTLVIGVVACCAVGIRCLPRRLARGSEIDVDDNPVNENV